MSDWDRYVEVDAGKLPGNPFTTEDALYTEDSNNSSVVNATLALAHEQRTASLIAIWQTGDVESSGATFGITFEKRMAIWLEIDERLGLKP